MTHVLIYVATYNTESQQDEVILYLEKELGPEPSSYHKMRSHASPAKCDWVWWNEFITMSLNF